MKVRKHLQREQSRTTWNDYNTSGWYLEFLLNVIRKREYYSIVVGDVGKYKSCGKNKKQCIQNTQHVCSRPVVEFLRLPLWSCEEVNASRAQLCVFGCNSADIQCVNQASSWFWVTVILLRGGEAKTDQGRTRNTAGEGRKRGKERKRGGRKREACSLQPK